MNKQADGTPRRRVAVIGGGVGAMTAVFALTREPDWRERYEFDIYQLGWRLGGKGASGRDAAAGERIQEHGLHVWLGFYANAFRCMNACYEELARPPDAPLATIEDAFHKHSRVVFEEHIGGAWKPWVIDFPTNDALPWESKARGTVADYLQRLLAWAHELLHRDDHPVRLAAGAPATPTRPAWLQRLEQCVQHPESAHPALALLGSALGLARHGVESGRAVPAEHHEGLLWLLDAFKAWLERRVDGLLEHEDWLRHLYIGIDLALAVVRGMLRDGVIRHGSFNVINDYELRTWLVRNGANERISVRSAPMQAVYDLVFAYRDGDAQDPAKADLEAGTGLRGMLLMLFDYKGAYCWMMQAGMGDTIFAPYYQVLSGPDYRDNIRFHFFHRVLALDSEDGRNISRMSLARQVRLRDPAAGYDPLIEVKGLPCWPSEPRYEQLDPDDAMALREGHINLESWWTPWREEEAKRTFELELGRDYDQVLLAVPPSAAQYLFTDRIKALPQWQNWARMIDKVRTVQTQAVQYWTRPDLAGLGWTLGPPLLGAYAEPFSTWADMSHLLKVEHWPAEDAPHALGYFTGVWRDAPDIPPPSDHTFPARELAAVRTQGEAYFRDNLGTLWPDAMTAEGRFKPGVLRSQYWRCNVDPTERYVQSVTGSTRYRLRADGAGFENLFLAGDWVRNHLNAGCVEAATIGGLLAARAISGQAVAIVGDEAERHDIDPEEYA